MNQLQRAFGVLALALLQATNVSVAETDANVGVDETATIADSTAGFVGLSQITLSVRDLDATLAFYKAATGFPVIEVNDGFDTQDSASSEAGSSLYGGDAKPFRSVTLRAPNMLFELIEFADNVDAPAGLMPPQGPGMTHTCFQSPIQRSGFERFDAAGAQTISYGGKPVDLGGYGVTYAYAYDPEGNMIELEQLDAAMLERSGYMNTDGIDEHALWMSQVALATPDIQRLMAFYEQLMGFKPYRVAELKDNPKADAIAGIDQLDILGGWFRLNASPKVLEIWQYRNPKTEPTTLARTPRSLGYSFVLDVEDAKAQHARFQDMGVRVFSDPVETKRGWQFYARDIDGNVFAVRQPPSADSPFSARALDRRGG